MTPPDSDEAICPHGNVSACWECAIEAKCKPDSDAGEVLPLRPVFGKALDGAWHIAVRTYPDAMDTACGRMKLPASEFFSCADTKARLWCVTCVNASPAQAVSPSEHEREVPSRIPGFDAMEWVAMWRETIAEHPEIPHDDATMLGWFANAIMRGYDEYPRRPHDDQVSLPLPLAQRILAVLDNMPREFRALAAELRALLVTK